MYRYSWLFDRKTDLALFTLPFFIGGLAYVILQQDAIVSSVLLFFLATNFFGLGPLHLGPGWSHFTDPEIFNRVVGSGNKRLFAFLAVASILLVVPFAYVYFPLLVLSVYIAFTIHHLTQQNIGILRLYQNPGLEVLPDKEMQTRTVHWSAWFFSSLFIVRTAGLSDIEKVPLLIFAFCSLFIVVKTSIQLLSDLIEKQTDSGLPINLSGLIFWGVSILFLLPLGVMGREFNDAIIIPLMMHWVQYLGLNWILLKRKQKESIDAVNHFRNFLVSSIAAGTVVIGLGVIAVLLFESNLFAFNLLFGFVLAFSFVHYLQDAFIWRFSQPVLRKQILSYLKKPEKVDRRQLVGAGHAES